MNITKENGRNKISPGRVVRRIRKRVRVVAGPKNLVKKGGKRRHNNLGGRCPLHTARLKGRQGKNLEGSAGR